MKTWKDLKDETLQLMFSYSNLGALDLSDVNKDYLLAMPAAANYAMIELASIRPITKVVRISQYPVNNLLGTEPGEMIHCEGDMEFTAQNPRSYYFEVQGDITFSLEKDGAQIARGSNTEQRGFTAYRGSIEEHGKITIRFHGENGYAIANIAMYEESFDSADLIPAFRTQQTYDIRALGEGYMRIAPEQPVWYKGRDISAYVIRNRDKVIVDGGMAGEIQVYYHAYPARITVNTPDETRMELDDEALELVPLYMASRLYMDDDSGVSTLYYNMYDARKLELQAAQEFSASDGFISESGWV
ncbi:hypothetical protein KP626_07250 [Christensenella sp. MSJ-20]|uniref:hypothetical protein n=1 Tax=Christensenella sp. MSJ-20 TaxID=2841518 RepID=UPI001C78086C|nr:hypothetical protein KP626_07250 [Christensenella sp. MSJ-20]